MTKVIMSLLTVSLVVIALAATTAHAARSSAAVKVADKFGPFDGWIPYETCLSECAGTCVQCAFQAWWRGVVCKCEDSSNSKKAAVTTAHAAVKVADKSGPFDDWIPYETCLSECAGTCVQCAFSAWHRGVVCKCEDSSNSKKAAITTAHAAKGDLIPYTECMATCEVCACTLIWPPEANWCFPCSTKKKEIAAVQQLPKLSAVLFPRDECEENCNVHCACSLIYPPPKYCSCADPILSNAKSSKKPAVVAVQEVPTLKSSAMTVSECIESCNGVCGCGLIFPPETNVCHCFDSVNSKKQA